MMKNGDLRLPPDISGNLNARPGDTIEVETEQDGSVRIFPKTLKESDVAGMLKAEVRSTIEEMDEAVAKAFRKGKL